MSFLRQVAIEYGKEVLACDFHPIAGWIAHAWDPCEDLRVEALQKLFAQHQDNVRNLKRQCKFDRSTEIELWHPCVTSFFPPLEQGRVDQLRQDGTERSRRSLEVREANVRAWRIWHGFGEGPWTVSRKATPQDLATQSRWVQLNWQIHRSDGVLCPTNCLCSMCLRNGDLNDKQVKMLRRRRNPTETKEKLDATISAMIGFRHYCFDTCMSLWRRTNMDNNLRNKIDKRVHAELDWVRNKRVMLFTTEQEFKQREKELVSFIESVIHPSSHELRLDTLGAERRDKMREYFMYGDIVKVTDPSTGEGVIGEINFAIKSKRLGTGDDPDWVYIKDMWYRDNEVQLATTQDIRDYQSSVVQNQQPAGTSFNVGDIVKVTDKATCNTVIGKIDVTWSNGLVEVKGVQYAEDDVRRATTPERDGYQSSSVDSDNEAGNLFDGGISDVADVGAEHDKPLFSEHTAGFILHRRICKRNS